MQPLPAWGAPISRSRARLSPGLTAWKERLWRRFLAAVLFADALSFLIAVPGHIAGTGTAAAFVAAAHAATA
jgi:hypothetical protein